METLQKTDNHVTKTSGSCQKSSAIHPINQYRNYLFDADGTLIDTGEIVYQSYLHTCRKYGDIELTRTDVTSLMGLPLRVQLEQYLGKLQDDRYETIVAFFRQHQIKIYKEHLKSFDGIHSTLTKLKQSGKTLAIITSRNLKFLTKYLDELNLTEYFDLLVTPENTTKHKPDPEPVEYAVNKLNLNKEETVFIGDALFDIQSGHDAGVATAFVKWSPNNPDDFNVKPDYLLNKMEDLI